MSQTTTTKVRLACATLALIFFVAACQSKEAQLVGKWEQVDQTSNVIEFFKGGTVPWGSSTLNYKVLDDTTLRLDGGGNALTIKFSISGDTLTISEAESTSTFRRAKQ